MHKLQQAIYRRRLVSWQTMELRWCPDFMYDNFFSVWDIRYAQV